jgi:hypothetical protein
MIELTRAEPTAFNFQCDEMTKAKPLRRINRSAVSGSLSVAQ